MSRTPEQCRFRQLLPPTNDNETFCCMLAEQIVGAGEKDLYRVGPDACRACCTRPLPSPAAMNPVVASFVYQAAVILARDPSASWRRREEAVRAEIRRRHAGVRWERPSEPLGRRPLTRATEPPATRLSWAVGMLTAPREKSTIDRTLASLCRAGFDQVHIFAEPGSRIPGEFRHLPVTYQGRKLGNLGNFCTSLITLFMQEPRADCYAIFQDDIEVAAGLKTWCDTEFWPHGAGLVSLYTCKIYYAETSGWRIVKPDMTRTFGAQAFVFRRDVLKEFLTDGRMFELHETHPGIGDDAVVGEFATRRDIGIAYHTPSLIDHVGDVSAIVADAHGTSGPQSRTEPVGSVADIRTWKPPAKTTGRIGMIGWNVASGLGYLNRDLAAHLAMAKWLVPDHPAYPLLPDPKTGFPLRHVPLTIGTEDQRAWLRGLDWILFTERPYLPHIANTARGLGINVACVPMWELTDPETAWVHLVNLMICPTRFTFELLADWKRRFGLPWDVLHVPWPIDARRFAFRLRGKCKRFLFINGTSGCPGRRDNGSVTPYHRKGMEVVLEAARLLAPIPFIVYSQVRGPSSDPRERRAPPPAQGEHAVVR